jgi:hypothetical protein
MDQQRRYPLNAAGDFYVADGMCIACTAPEHEAPDLLFHDPEAHAGYHCYFKRQPGTPDELQRAVMAVAVGCCGVVRYGGDDSALLRQLAGLGAAEACDRYAERDTAADGGGR